MESAKRTIEKARAQQSVERARISHPPFRGEARFSIGDNVPVYRTATKAWEGPYQAMEFVGEADVVVKNITTGSHSTFETTLLKFYHSSTPQTKEYLKEYRNRSLMLKIAQTLLLAAYRTRMSMLRP
jgi:hypothetical protein